MSGSILLVSGSISLVSGSTLLITIVSSDVSVLFGSAFAVEA